MPHSLENVDPLRTCVFDLISLQTLPALWNDRSPVDVTTVLLDALMRMLRLDFAFARLGGDDAGRPIDVVRLPRGGASNAEAAELARALEYWLTSGAPPAPGRVHSPLGPGEVAVTSFRLGLQNETGVLAAGSSRADFPTETETLVLRMAAKQAVIGLQEASRNAESARRLSEVSEELGKETSGRQRAERARVALASLIENSTDFIGIASLDGRVLFLNPAGRRMVGLEGDDAVPGGRILDYVMEDERERVKREVLPAVTRDGAWEGEVRFRHHTGGVPIAMWQHLFFITEPATGRRVALATISRDITQRKRAERALRTSEERFRRYFDLGLIGMAITSPEQGCVEVNDELCRLLGYGRDELLQMKWSDITHPDDLPADLANFNRVLAGEFDGYTIDKRWLCKDGRVIDSTMAAQCVRRPDGSVDFVVGLVLDTTERKHAEGALTEAFEEIKTLRDQLAREKRYLEEEIRTERGFEEIVGESPALQQVLAQVRTVAPTDSTVLIQGETGTGKELIARAIHDLSLRRERTFVKINCAAIPTGLLEGELFGHEKGAFTGAIARRVGRFELADGGTMFLDEVGDIPAELQPKLLRVLQEHEFERLGSTRTMRVDVRLIAATNRDLRQMVADKEFRSDLFYRLDVFPITVPPVRERPEDIPRLVEHFTRKYARKMNRAVAEIPAEIMAALQRYPWPGNVREIENLIERSVIVSRGRALEVLLPDFMAAPREPVHPRTLDEAEREHIVRALNECRWVIAGSSGAAAKLGMKRTSLQYRMQKLGISKPR